MIRSRVVSRSKVQLEPWLLSAPAQNSLKPYKLHKPHLFESETPRPDYYIYPCLQVGERMRVWGMTCCWLHKKLPRAWDATRDKVYFGFRV